MSTTGNSPFEPVNDPIQVRSQLTACIEILNFDDLLQKGEINTIQVFYESIAQEIYNTRKKNYTWGFRVIEPEFRNFMGNLVLVSKLYKEENLYDLNSVIFKLFTEFCNIILSTALHMHIPIRGMVHIGENYMGKLKSRKPAVISGNDPLILSDLLKVFTLNEIFPTGYRDGLIPAVHMPFHFGQGLCQSKEQLESVESIGIFMSQEFNQDKMADVTILSNMMAEAEVNGMKCFACNWKEWMSEHLDCSPENIIAFAEAESAGSGPHAKKWQSLVNYTEYL